MSDKLKPVPCGCGGEAVVHEQEYGEYEVYCPRCFITTDDYKTETDAITAWNRAMGSTEKSSPVERTAEVIEHEMIITDADGCSYHRTKYICGNCKKKVIGGDEYCSHCGSRLDWDEDIPMEYFENGGI